MASKIKIRPGAWLLNFRQKFGMGLRVAWYRDVVRQRILHTPPVKHLVDESAEVHVLTSEDDWLNLIWTLKSFYKVSDKSFRLVIHEDGSLQNEGLQELQHHFPDARIIRRKEADKTIEKVLKAYPASLHFRQTNNLALKIFDFPVHLQAERMILLDSDVLFFRRPDVLMERILSKKYKVNSVNRDVSNALNVSGAVVKERLGFDLLERFNSGLGLIHKDSLQLGWIEEFLQLPDILSHFWRIEQTLFALCSCRFGVEFLPDEYDVYLDRGINNRPSRHYVGAVRHLMYAEGMRQCMQILRASGTS